MMIPADVIVLSSSPDPPQRTPNKAICDPETRFGISPPAATPPSLLQLPSRSRFFPTPSAPNDDTKKKGRSKPKITSLDGIDKDAAVKPKAKPKKATKEIKSGVLADLEPESLGSRKNAAKNPAASQKGRSRSSAKSKEQGNMTLAGKVTKSSNEPKDASKSGNKTSVTGKSPSGDQQAQKPNALKEDEGLHLDEAMRRRMDWTPPRETNAKDDSAGGGNGDDLANANEKRTGNAFGKILSDYNYSGLAGGARDATSNVPVEGPTKRRRIEV